MRPQVSSLSQHASSSGEETTESDTHAGVLKTCILLPLHTRTPAWGCVPASVHDASAHTHVPLHHTHARLRARVRHAHTHTYTHSHTCIHVRLHSMVQPPAFCTLPPRLDYVSSPVDAGGQGQAFTGAFNITGGPEAVAVSDDHQRLARCNGPLIITRAVVCPPPASDSLSH